MLVIQPIRAGTAPIGQIDARVSCGEMVTVRIGRSGLSLDFAPLGNAQVRAMDPAPRAMEAYGGCLRGAVLLSAGVDGRTAGAAAAVDGGRGWCELLDLRVDLTYRRQGIGRELLEACRSYAERAGLAGVSMAVSDGNPVMCRFAQQCGFQLEGMDRLALTQLPEERIKPLLRRACELFFYLPNEKG